MARLKPCPSRNDQRYERHPSRPDARGGGRGGEVGRAGAGAIEGLIAYGAEAAPIRVTLGEA